MSVDQNEQSSVVAWTAPGVTGLLIYSFLLTLGRAATLPFMAVHLSQVLFMSVAETGVILSLSLAIGTLVSLLGGHFIDQLRSAPVLAVTALAAGFGFAALPYLSGAVVVTITLSLLYAILAVSSIVVKAGISTALAEDLRIRVFALNYTLINVAFAIGPLISVFLIALDTPTAFGFAVAMCLAAIATVFVLTPSDRVISCPSEPQPTLRASLRIVRADRLLLLFTLGGVLSAVVYDQFSAYLSLYLLTFLKAEEAHRLIGQIVTANALVVIATQYWLSSQIKRHRLLAVVLISTACLIVGLGGFAFATVPMAWFIAMVIFTIGEVLMVPAEYFYVDLIAPKSKLGLYFAVHNLSALGGAASPVLCSMLLVLGGPAAMFGILTACAIGGAVLYAIGHRRMHHSAAPPQS